ncbi:MAG: hypothetical protein HY648_02700 [Acidobacteria bacterium]|nr:hypothetical protein [Acidobacteriota bacterium]
MKKPVTRNHWNLLLLVLAIPILVSAFSSGPIPGVTGGFGEPTCNQSGCHTGTGVNAGPGRVTITTPESYTSGGTFPITVTVGDPNQRRWGFELSARTQAGQQAGTLIPGSDGFTQLTSPLRGIQYIEHTITGTRSGVTGGVSFSFLWRAPDVSVGPVVFNVAANAANADFNHTGDRIYTNEVTVLPAPPPPVSGTPLVNEGGTVNNASFAPGTNPVAPGTIVAIFGTNLTDGSSAEFSAFGNDGKLLTTLAGARVTINGIAAPIFSAFPTQINAQMPTELAGVTSATIEVTVGDQTSTPRTFFVDPVSPGIFTVPSGGQGPGAITHADGSLVTTQNPAQPGEVVVIFGTGLGAVNPPVATGAPAASLHTTTATPTVTIDGLPAEVQFSGLAPGFVGLNQVNVRIPPGTRSADDIPVVLTIGGKQSNPVTIAILDSP